MVDISDCAPHRCVTTKREGSERRGEGGMSDTTDTQISTTQANTVCCLYIQDTSHTFVQYSNENAAG